MVTLNPYLNFRDNAREAMEFYHSVFGGDLNVSTFADFQSAEDPSENDLVMHAQLDGPGLTLMGADTPKRMDYNGISGFSVSLSGPNEDDAALCFPCLRQVGINVPCIDGGCFQLCAGHFRQMAGKSRCSK